MSDHEKQFSDWLDGKLSEQDQASFEEMLSGHDKWQQRGQVAGQLKHQVEIQGEQKVPTWDRSNAFSTDKKAWWQWKGLPAMSMAFSLLAVALVLFKVELVVQPQGLLLSFARSSTTQQAANVEALVNQKLREFASEQQVVLANYAADAGVRQQSSNLELASYILLASRQERSEDINEFIGYINDQRKDEKLDQALKFQHLEYEIKAQKITSTNARFAIKASTNESKINN